MKLLLFVFLAGLSGSLSYNVLVYFPAPSRSHTILGRGVVRALLDNGHQVTWATSFPELSKPEKGLKLIDVSVVKNLTAGVDVSDKNKFSDFSIVFEFAKNITKYSLDVEAMKQALIKEQFDAVVSEWFFDDVPAGIAAVLNCPWLLLSGIPLSPKIFYNVDDPITMVTIPNFMMLKNPPLNFLDRVKNSIGNFFMFYGDWSQSDEINNSYNKIFEPIAAARNIPLKPFSSARFDVSVLLVNSHPSIFPAISVPPNVIDIGGYHIDDETPPLPKDLKDILDNSPNGVVYFSMGSVINGSVFFGKEKNDIFRVFKSLKQTVLWKFEQKIDNLPKNVHIRPWMPQASILAHPNVKVFITHGGFLSTLESIKHGVPQILIPVFGDQPANALRAEYFGYGQKVELGENLIQDLEVKLKEVLGNDRYGKKAKSLSSIFRKRSVPPRKLIADYVSLAIETKGAHHLRPISHQYTWYQRYMLDIFALIFVTILVLIKMISVAIKSVFRKDKKSKTKSDKKRN